MCLNAQHIVNVLYKNYIKRYKSMSYSCITSWRLNNSYSTVDEQPPCD